MSASWSSTATSSITITPFLLLPLLLILTLFSGPICALVEGPWSDTSLPPEARAAKLVEAMTMDEKLAMLHGPSTGKCCQCNTSASCAYVGNVVGNKRLGIPPMTANDGPQGFRDNNLPGSTTAFPSGLTMAASFDTNALFEWGSGMGKEFFDKGANVQLGPGLCLARVPRNGRNFEYLSGEDPYLGYKLVQPAVSGIQSQKVVANVKHYVMNNQETNRHGVSENVDERTRFEMYYPPFRGAVEADAGSAMCSYNKINGKWSCENPETLAGDFKKTTGFKGFVMSDWGATHSTSLMAGLDMEMPSANFMNPQAIKAGIAAGNMTAAAVNEAVQRILYAYFLVGVMDVPLSTWDWSKLKKNVTTPASATLCRRLAATSTVLLKNDGAILPLSSSKKNIKLALIGFAGKGAVVHGGGSGEVVPSHLVSPEAGIRAAMSGNSGSSVEINNGTDIESAAADAAKADVAIVFAGTLSHEGGDRASLSLDDGCQTDTRPGHRDSQCEGNANNQNALIAAVAKAQKNTVVVMSIPGAILMPWGGDVPAILTSFMPGQEFGGAIADVLFGHVNPSAKLPITLPNKENETEFSPAQWPGLPDPANPSYANYTEKLLVGYRYYDAHKIAFTTGFPFGHGLSYTSFGYKSAAVAVADSQAPSISFTLSNTGKVSGAEVAQLYLAFPAAAGEPPKQLKGFEKVLLQPGDSKTVTFNLSFTDLSIWDVSKKSWSVVKGEYTAFIGSSSRDIRLTTKFTV